MESNHCFKLTLPPVTEAVLNRVFTLLGALSSQQLLELEAYARSQSARSRWNPAAERYLSVQGGPELVQEVIEDVLVGVNHPNQGRHPRPHDLVSTDTFTQYLRGAIRSKRSSLSENAEAKAEHVTLDSGSEAEDLNPLSSLSDPSQDTETADLAKVAFAQLREELGRSGPLTPALDLWEANLSYVTRAEDLGLSPKQYRNLRKRLRRIFHKLDFAPALSSPNGKEIAL